MKVDFVYSEISDLVFHFLAHMKVYNASDLYSEKYIESIRRAKNGSSDIMQEAASLSSYYNNNFERLGVINFLPFYCAGFGEFKDLLLGYNAFCGEDKERFIYPLLDCLERENIFYSDYWKGMIHTAQEKRVSSEEYIKESLQKYSCLFRYFEKNSAVVCFSFSLTRNGRGLGNENAFAAIVPYPQNDAEYQNCFFTLLHEYTHSFTDALIGSDINMKDGSHDLSEKVVILFDYYLIKALNNVETQAYIAWLEKNSDDKGETISESQFLSIYKISDSLNNTLLALVQDIIMC